MSILEKTSYKFEELRTIKELRDVFTNNGPGDAWLFLSIPAFHGTDLTLDDIELILDNQSNIAKSVNGRWWITALVVYPKRTSLAYADIMIDSDDVQWLRERVRETLKYVEDSQYGNT